MIMREWVRLLKEDGVKVWCISAGFLATRLAGDPEFMRKIGAPEPSIGGKVVTDVVEG